MVEEEVEETLPSPKDNPRVEVQEEEEAHTTPETRVFRHVQEYWAKDTTAA